MTSHLACRRSVLGWLAAGFVTGCSRSPRLAPEFDYTNLDGSRASGGQLRGKVVLVNFWATSCATCVAEMPRLVELHQRWRARGFETLAVAMSWDPPARVADFAQSRRLPFAVAIDNTGAIARAWGDVKATPTTFLVDRQGRVVAQWVGEPDFARIDALAAELLSAS